MKRLFSVVIYVILIICPCDLYSLARRYVLSGLCLNEAFLAQCHSILKATAATYGLVVTHSWLNHGILKFLWQNTRNLCMEK